MGRGNLSSAIRQKNGGECALDSRKEVTEKRRTAHDVKGQKRAE